MKIWTTLAAWVLGGMLIASPVTAGELYIGSGNYSGGTITFGGATSSQTRAYAGKVTKTMADGKVIHGRVEAETIAASKTVLVSFWLSGVGPSEKLTSISGGTFGGATTTTVTYQAKHVSFLGRINPDTGRGFIRRLLTDQHTGQTTCQPGAKKIPVYLIGEHLFSTFEDEDGGSMRFHARQQ